MWGMRVRGSVNRRRRGDGNRGPRGSPSRSKIEVRATARGTRARVVRRRISLLDDSVARTLVGALNNRKPRVTTLRLDRVQHLASGQPDECGDSEKRGVGTGVPSDLTRRFTYTARRWSEEDEPHWFSRLVFAREATCAPHGSRPAAHKSRKRGALYAVRRYRQVVGCLSSKEFRNGSD